MINSNMIKNLMKQKLNDVCMELNVLKQRRSKLRRRMLKFGVQGKKMIVKCDRIAKVARSKQRLKNLKKYEWNSRKEDMVELRDKVPGGVSDLVEGVNVFDSEVEPSEPIGPMVCSN